MLKFISDNDFLLVDKYKQNDDGSVSWTYNESNVVHSGLIREGMTRPIQLQDGTEQVKVGEKLALDSEGNQKLDDDGLPLFEPVYEEQPKYITETVDIWAKLQSNIASKAITVEGKTQEEIEAEQIAEFKAGRELLIANSIITTESGNKYDGDNTSIQKMANKVISYGYAGKLDSDTLEWSLADTGTGVMTTVTLGELKEAHHLAVEYVQSVWGL